MVTVSGGLITIDKLLLAVCTGLDESVAVTVNEKVPAVVGVPLIWPLVKLSVRPAGSAPLVTAQLYGVVPPLAASVVE